MTIEANIFKALCERMETFAGGYSIAYPNVKFTPTDATYIEVAHLPNGFAYEGISEAKAHQGILQLTVVSPEQEGAIAPKTIAGNLADHFAKDSQFYETGVAVKVTNNPSIGQTLPDQGKARTPVTINYQARPI